MTGRAEGLASLAMNLLGIVEHPVLGESPYRVDRDGRPYVPAGDGGIVLGLQLGDSAFALAADHAAPGASLGHPDPAARLALAGYACIGNPVEVRTGPAAGARGAVIGQRGEGGRVLTTFAQADLARMRPGDQVTVRACGQGWRPAGFPAQVTVQNLDPDLLAALPVTVRPGTGPSGTGPADNGSAGTGASVAGTAGAGPGGPAGAGDPFVIAGVRAVVPSRLAGNGIGRPAVGWDLDLQLDPGGPDGQAEIALGDLVAVADIDARYNIGYRRGWVTVGVVGHGASPLPGHGPGITPILTGPGTVLRAVPDAAGHVGLTAAALKLQ